MNAQHTSGPWAVAEGDGCFVVETDDSTVRFVVMGLNMEGDRSNAQLIAAAPELLAALNEINMAACYASEEATETREAVLLQIGELARAAIAKATGSQS